uniref:F-box domain-containing protein n=1 Tax=Romanomermis culicivorax TaxID=13658 RepID=A0A915K022_ROMCU
MLRTIAHYYIQDRVQCQRVCQRFSAVIKRHQWPVIGNLTIKINIEEFNPAIGERFIGSYRKVKGGPMIEISISQAFHAGFHLNEVNKHRLMSVFKKSNASILKIRDVTVNSSWEEVIGAFFERDSKEKSMTLMDCILESQTIGNYFHYESGGIDSSCEVLNTYLQWRILKLTTYDL